MMTSQDASAPPAEQILLPHAIKKTPVVIQMEATECGAAALAIILTYYGTYESLENLRVECGVSRDGCSAANVITAARKFRLIANGYMLDNLQDMSDVRFPFIAFWEFNHFVVVEGIKRNRVYLNDPAIGRYSVSQKDFNSGFTGFVIELFPGDTYKKIGSRPSVIRFLSECAGRSWYAFAFAILITLSTILPGMIVPGFSKIFIDDILVAHHIHWAIPLMAGILAMAIFRSAVGWVQSRFLMFLGLKITLSGAARVLWHVLYLPINYFQQRYTGDILERFGANARISSLLTGGVISAVIGVIQVIFFGILVFILNWQMAVMALTVIGLNAGILFYISPIIADKNRFLLKESSKLGGIQLNNLHSMETIRATQSDNFYFIRWANCHMRIKNLQQQMAMLGYLLSLLPTFLNMMASTAYMAYGGWMIMSGAMTVGTLVAMQSLLSSFVSPISTLLGLGQSLQQVRGDVSRLNDILQHPKISHRKHAEQAQQDKIRGDIVISDVTFAYAPTSPPVISHVSLTVKENQRIAIVGATGGGKSSFVKLLCRFYQPSAGSITLAGMPIEDIDSGFFARSVGYVDQDIFLFEGTIQDNLTFWDNTIPEERLLAALELACIKKDVMKRGGLTSHVGEGGLNYSYGQRQRLEIARVLVKEPSILLLDEATSALDPIVEAEIYANIKSLNCTIIAVAHRLATIRDADTIYLIRQGQVLESGTHEELMAKEQAYYTLYNT